MTGIYKITSPSGRIYVGQSWDIKARWAHYRWHKGVGQTLLHNSFKKYSVNAHTFDVLHELPKDVEQEIMNDYELLYWRQYKDCGFNMLNAAEPKKSCKLSEITKKKISEYGKGRKKSEEHRRKIGDAHIGMKRSEETRKRMSEANSGENNPNFGKKHTKETRKKMREAMAKIYKKWMDALIILLLLPISILAQQQPRKMKGDMDVAFKNRNGDSINKRGTTIRVFAVKDHKWHVYKDCHVAGSNFTDGFGWIYDSPQADINIYRGLKKFRVIENGVLLVKL